MFCLLRPGRSCDEDGARYFKIYWAQVETGLSCYGLSLLLKWNYMAYKKKKQEEETVGFRPILLVLLYFVCCWPIVPGDREVTVGTTQHGFSLASHRIFYSLNYYNQIYTCSVEYSSFLRFFITFFYLDGQPRHIQGFDTFKKIYMYIYIAQSVNNQSYSGILLSLGCNVF